MSEIERRNRRLLLISNSTLYGSGYLDHAEAEIRSLLGTVRRVLFVPLALADRDGYAATARARLAAMGYGLDAVHEAADAGQAVDAAEAVFIGGGNTFRLLKGLYNFELLQPIRRRVAEGMPYIGSSAGSIVACPTLKTTKDMPIVEPPSFEALGLVAFQISPHYLDPDPNTRHMGETQEERINQFLEENDAPVIGLREGTMLRVKQGSVILKGITSARIFRRAHAPVEVEPESRLDEFLSSGAERGGL
ncbi:MAG: dipeptidase PepE [Blastocatellia bacterium]